MAKKKYKSYNLFISILSVLVIGGCTVEQTYKTLVFFFDGVPPLEKNATQSINSPQKLVADLEKEQPEKKEEQLKLNIHKPYLDRKCELCHTPNRELLAPMPGLCYKCHKDYQEQFAFVHAPVLSGNCTKCHNQHLSELPKLLIREGQDLCLFCHSKTMNYVGKYHNNLGDGGCTLCHNPHGGKDKNLIRENVPSEFNGLASLYDFASRRIFARVFINKPGDIPSGKEIVVQNNDDNFKVVFIEKIGEKGKFFIDKIKKSGNYTIRLKGEEYDSIRLNFIDYKDNVLYDFGYSNKNKFQYPKSLYDSLHNLLKINSLYGKNAIVNNLDNNSQLDSLRLRILAKNNLKNTASIPITSEFAVEFLDSLNNEERQETFKYSEMAFQKLYAYKKSMAYIYVAVIGKKITLNQAKNKAIEIKDYLREKGITGRRVKFAEIARMKNYENNTFSSALKITIIVK